MVDNKKEKARSKLSSAEPATRIEGFQELWETLQSVLQKHLKGKIKNEQDREDVVQDTFERLHKSLLNKSLPPNSCIEAFSVTVADHRLIELERRRKTGTEKTAEFAYRYMEKDAPTAEEQGMEQVASEQAIALPFHLSNETELLLAVQLAHLKHKPDEIASLNGWNKQDVHNAMRRVKRELQQRREQADASVTAPSSWERKLACAPGHHAFGFSYVNIFPRNLAPESEKALLQQLEVHDMQEAYQKYIFMLRIDNVNTAEPRESLTVLPRGALVRGIFGKEPVDYIDYVPHFHRVTEQGSWKNVIELTQRFDYSAKLTEIYYDNATEQLGSEWVFPKLHICIRKPFSEKMLTVDASTPEKRNTYVGLYRVYPIEEAGKYPGVACT